MQRWHLTLGLTGVALAAGVLAPRLIPLLSPPADPPPPQTTVRAPLPPASAGTLQVDAGLDRSAVEQGYVSERFLTIRVTAPDVDGQTARRPVDLGVVIDASGSMSARGKIDFAKRAAKLLATRLDPQDDYSLVMFNDDATTVVPSGGVRDVAALHRAIDRIYEGGGTNLYAGMDQGARQIRSTLEDHDIGRMIVLSDGNANVGVTDHGAMARFAADQVSQGVTVSTIGLGLDYNEDLLAQLADVGGGSYDFVDDPRELEAVFSDELARTVSVVARNTSVNIQLGDGVEPLEVIGWDAQRVDSGWQVFLGDVVAGESRKIVARVRVHGQRQGERSMADVTARYEDLVKGELGQSTATATGVVTNDARVIEASLDRQRAIDANRAYGSWYVEMSTRAYAQGDRRRSLQYLDEGRQVLQDASRHLNAPALQDDVQALDTLGYLVEEHAPMSAEGKKHIKGYKERVRVLSR